VRRRVPSSFNWALPEVSKHRSAFLFKVKQFILNKRAGLLHPEDEGNAILRNDGYYAPNGML
jgi:hypothetical protein